MAGSALLTELFPDPFEDFFAEARREALLVEPPPPLRAPVDDVTVPAPPPPLPPPSLAAPIRPEPIFLGTERASPRAEPLPYSWNLADSPNAFVMAIGSSGSGKTELLRVLGQELGAQGLPVVCLDFHGDLALPGLRRLQLGPQLGINPLEIRPGAPGSAGQRAVVAQILKSVVKSLGHIQDDLLADSLDELLASPSAKPATLADLRRVLQRREEQLSKRQAAAGLLAALRTVFDDPAFRAARHVSTAQLLAHGASIDLCGLSADARTVAAGAVLAQVFEALRAAGPLAVRGQLRCFVLLDEAAVMRESPFVETIAKEARKFGLGLAVATQQATDLGESLRANAASAAVFRAHNLKEAKHGAELFDGLAPDQLMRLSVGECFFRDAAGLRRLRIVPTFERAAR